MTTFAVHLYTVVPKVQNLKSHSLLVSSLSNRMFKPTIYHEHNAERLGGRRYSTERYCV